MFLKRAFTFAFLACLSAASFAQYPLNKVSLFSRVSLTTFGSASGNSCFGFVSPSGREYAAMGLDNKVAFVEITNPRAPRIVASIPHTANLWADIKIYRNACYVSSEAAIGIQVIDLSQIDSNIVTLVRTIASPARNHTLALNPDSGFLYTSGSEGGTGISACFDLNADPLNPIRTGATTLTRNADNTSNVYVHEAQIVSYTTGPYAGKEIMFACCGGQGLKIYDVTDKGAPILVKSVTYPNLGYCHQGWLSADRRYFYMDDEFDEDDFNINSRTIMFDVSSLENASYIGAFSGTSPAIDHNQYIREGFLFQANYRSGLRVWDTNDSQTAPTQTGFFDTYPTNDNKNYNGAWNVYPYFPSNTVIVSDIERGLFVLNVQQATTRTFGPQTYAITSGEELGGDVNSLKSADDNKLALFADSTSLTASVQFEGTTAVKRLAQLRVRLEASVERGGTVQTLELYRFSDNTWQNVDGRTATVTDSTFEITISANVENFVGPNNELRARTSWSPINDEDPSQDGWTHNIDQFNWTAVPYAS